MVIVQNTRVCQSLKNKMQMPQAPVVVDNPMNGSINNRDNDMQNVEGGGIISGSGNGKNLSSQLLNPLGYSQELHRGMSSLMSFAIGFTEVAVLSSICLTYGNGLASGGPAVLIWGFAVNFLMTMIVANCFGEVCAAYPLAGSVYTWAGQLVPPEHAALASYVTGWLNWLGNSSGDASFAFGFTSFLSSALVASGMPPIGLQQQVGYSILVLAIWSALNFFRIDQVGVINNMAALLHCGGIIVIILSLAIMTPSRNDASVVLTEFYNGTGWENKSFVVCIGLTSALFAFTGYDASAQMAEETDNSVHANSASKGIINTCLATGIGGLCFLLALLTSTTNIDLALGNISDDSVDASFIDTGNAASNVFQQATSVKFGTGLTWIVVLNLFFAGIASVSVTARISYAFARDGGFPYSKTVAHLDPRTKSPINSIIFVFLFDAIIMLLPLAPGSGVTAFYSIISLSTFGFQTSYAIPLLLKAIYDPAYFPKTEMSLGKWSRPCCAIGSMWLLTTCIFLFFPTTAPLGPENFNWLVVVSSGVGLLMFVNWKVNAKYRFKGPQRQDQNVNNVETSHRIDNQIDNRSVANANIN